MNLAILALSAFLGIGTVPGYDGGNPPTGYEPQNISVAEKFRTVARQLCRFDPAVSSSVQEACADGGPFLVEELRRAAGTLPKGEAETHPAELMRKAQSGAERRCREKYSQSDSSQDACKTGIGLVFEDVQQRRKLVTGFNQISGVPGDSDLKPLAEGSSKQGGPEIQIAEDDEFGPASSERLR